MPENARAELTEASKLDGKSAALDQLGRYADAVPVLERSLEIRRRNLGEEDPETAANLNLLALCFEGAGKYTRAKPLFRKALAIDAKNPSALRGLAAIDLQTGRFDPAQSPNVQTPRNTASAQLFPW